MKRLTGQIAALFAIIMVQTLPPTDLCISQKNSSCRLFSPVSLSHCRPPVFSHAPAGGALCQPMLSPKPVPIL